MGDQAGPAAVTIGGIPPGNNKDCKKNLRMAEEADGPFGRIDDPVRSAVQTRL
jgi:hypothetical protein